MNKVLLLFLANLFFNVCISQELYIPRDIKKAYERGTRSWDGNPGPTYFQNRADYIIEVEFDPETKLLKGYEKILYQNNSKFSLRYVVIRLYQNIFKEGGVRGRAVDPGDTHDGVKITSLTIKGEPCNLETDHCLLRESQTNIYLPFNCAANSVAEIEIGWEFTMPAKPNDRFGGYDENTFFMGYWFPQISVFDDINGWDIYDYNAVAEFYNEYGDFDVKITVPENYIVWGTGNLQNPEVVLKKKFLERYHNAMEEEKTVKIIEAKDRKRGKEITLPGPNTWHYKADNVSDFAFGTSSRYLWDASTMTSISGKKIFLQSAYNSETKNFDKVIGISRWNVEEMERNIIGVEFPYSTMTAFNGAGGMEYPMLINDHDGSLVETIFVTSHEIAHSYFPFLVGTNQRRHGWLDEGLVTMLGMEVHFKQDSTMNLRKNYTEIYSVIAGTQADIPQMVNSVEISDNIFQLHEYLRPSLGFWTLRDIMGADLFHKCIIEFIKRWEGKHPTPWDFFFTCNSITGEDYSWFFESWFNQFGYPDLSILSAQFDNDSIDISIENTGGMPFPSKLIISFTDGSTDEIVLEGNEWRDSKIISISTDTRKTPVNVRLDTSGYPDCDEGNNLFEF